MTHAAFDPACCEQYEVIVRHTFRSISNLGVQTQVFRSGPLDVTLRACRMGSDSESMLCLGYYFCQQSDIITDSDVKNTATATTTSNTTTTVWSVHKADALSLYAESPNPLDGEDALEHLRTAYSNSELDDVLCVSQYKSFYFWRDLMNNPKIKQTDSFVVELKLQYNYFTYPTFAQPSTSTDVMITCKDGISLYMNNEQLLFFGIDIQRLQTTDPVVDDSAPGTPGERMIVEVNDGLENASSAPHLAANIDQKEDANEDGRVVKPVEPEASIEKQRNIEEVATATVPSSNARADALVDGEKDDSDSASFTMQPPLCIETGYFSADLLQFFNILFYNKMPPYDVSTKVRVFDIAKMSRCRTRVQTTGPVVDDSSQGKTGDVEGNGGANANASSVSQVSTNIHQNKDSNEDECLRHVETGASIDRQCNSTLKDEAVTATEASSTTSTNSRAHGTQVCEKEEHSPLRIQTDYPSTDLLRFFHILFYNKMPPYYITDNVPVLDIAKALRCRSVRRRVAEFLTLFEQNSLLSSIVLADTYDVPMLRAFANNSIASDRTNYVNAGRPTFFE